MTFISFPLRPSCGQSIQIELSAVLGLAVQAAALIGKGEYEEMTRLHDVIGRYGIPHEERGQAVRELALGFSLFSASPFTIGQVENIAESVHARALLNAVDEALKGSGTAFGLERLTAAYETYAARCGYHDAIGDIAETVLKNLGLSESGLKLIDRLVKASASMGDLNGAALALMEIAAAFKAHDAIQTRGVFEAALVAARKNTDDPRDRIDDLYAIADYFREIGDRKRAAQVLWEVAGLRRNLKIVH